MSEYLFPTPGRALRKLLDHYAQSKEQWPEYLCVQDIMLAMDRGDVKPYRYYEERWKRSKSWIGDNIKRLKEDANLQRSFTISPDKRGQTPDKRGQESRLNGVKLHSRGQTPDKRGQTPDSIEQIQNSNTYLKGTNVPVDKIDWMARYREVRDSWNQFATSQNLRTIRTISDTRRKWIRTRYDLIMPHVKIIYQNLKANDYLMGRTDSYEGITFETLWKNKEHYLKYLEMTPKKRNGKHTNGVHYKPVRVDRDFQINTETL